MFPRKLSFIYWNSTTEILSVIKVYSSRLRSLPDSLGESVQVRKAIDFERIVILISPFSSLISWNDDCLSRLCGDWLTVVKVVVVADVFAGISVGAGVVVVVVGILFYSGSFIQAR